MALLDRVTGPDGVTRSITNTNTRRVDTQKDSETPGFELPYGEDGGVYYEPSKPAEPEKTRAQRQVEEAEAMERTEKLHSRFDGPGVAVEISTESVKAAERAVPKTIGDIFRETLSQIREFFVALWTGGETTAESAIPQEIDEIEEAKPADMPVSDTEQGTLNPQNDAETIASFMVDYGGRRLAKNSDLLTQYDRTGHITTPNASDRRRILQGDGKTRHYY